MAATLVLDIVANAAKAVSGLRDLDRAAGNASSGADKARSKIGGMAKAAAVAAGAAALGGMVAIIKTGVGEQKDFLAGQAQLANGIKSTNNAANVTVGGLEDLASSIQNYSGQTDDSIVASEKLLLTFTNVGNKAGKNNDIFNQATKMTADMAAKMGGDASKYAVQLGKALNDPTKGITALTRVGVTFTAAQKKSIKSMQDSGNTLGAQKVIMAELRKEFGGSAKAAGETLPGQMARAQRSFEDVSQSVVASLMPAITFLADILTGTLLPAFTAVVGWMTNHKAAVLAFAVAIGAVYTAIKVGQASSAVGAAGGLAAWIKQTNLAAGATKIWAGIQAAFNAIMALNPVVLIVAALVLLGVALVVAYKKSETFRNIVQGAFRGVASAARAVWSVIRTAFDAIKKIIGGVIDWLLHSKIAAVLLGPWRIALGALNALIHGGIKGLLAYFSGLLSAITRILSGVWAVITAPFKAAWDWVKGRAKAAIDGWGSIVKWVSTALSGVWTAIVAPFKSGWTRVKTYIGNIKNGFSGAARRVGSTMSGVWTAIVAPFKSAWSTVKTYVTNVKNAFAGAARRVGSGLSGVWTAIITPFQSAWHWVRDNVAKPIKNMFDGLAGAITSAMHGVTSAITAPFSAAWTWIKNNVLSPIKGAWNTVANGINAIHVSFTVPSNIATRALHLAGKGFTFDPPNIPTINFATGGYVTRATNAIVGEAGPEFVAPEAMLRRIIRDEGGSGTVININGALDPVAVARQVKSILSADQRRTSGVVRNGARTVGVTA